MGTAYSPKQHKDLCVNAEMSTHFFVEIFVLTFVNRPLIVGFIAVIHFT